MREFFVEETRDNGETYTYGPFESFAEAGELIAETSAPWTDICTVFFRVFKKESK